MDPIPKVVDPIPVATEIIRTPAHGPDPANTLAFIRCRGSGADIQVGQEQLVRFEIAFKTKFQIDGYLQQKHDWYLENTLVSATGMIRLLNTVSDVEFLFALDTVDPFIDLDGVLGFNCRLALQIDGVGLFEREWDIDFAFNVSAYVLLYEPPANVPPSGKFKPVWRYDPNDDLFQLGHTSDTIKSTNDQSGISLRFLDASRAVPYGQPAGEDQPKADCCGEAARSHRKRCKHGRGKDYS